MFLILRSRSLLAVGAFLFALLSIALPDAALAQVLPVPRQTDWDQERQRFQGEALREFNHVLTEWRAAAAANDARSAARFYTGGAIMHFLPGPPAEGRAAIERTLEEVLPTIGQLRTGVSDFSASTNLAYAMGRFWYDQRDAEGRVSNVTGTYVVVAERQGRTWRIRSQMFKPEPIVQ